MSISGDGTPVSALHKYCIALESDDKKRRRKALEELKIAVFDNESETKFEVNVKNVYKHVLRCFSDPAEVCREKSICFITEVLKVLPGDTECYFPYIIPILVQRLGNIEIVEPSEEVRLLLMELYHLIINKFQSCLPQYVEEMVQILLKTLNDPFPKIKKEACDSVCDLSKAIPRQLYSHTAMLVKPILQNFNYQHSKIRVAAVYATGQLFIRGDSKSVEHTLVPLAERLFDQTPTVRRAVIEIVGKWMLDMPDRYSFFSRLLPLLLTGLHDTVPELRSLTEELWSNIGQQYLLENEDSLKDQIDFLPENAPNYPSNMVRPSLGCRVLARRFFYNCVPALVNEMKDWREDVRLRAVQLAGTFAVLAETNATHHLPVLADALSRAAEDEDPRVAESAACAGEALGAFVPAASWARLLLPEEGDAPPARGRLRLLAALLRPAPAAALPPLLPLLARRVCGAEARAAAAVDAPRRHAALDCCDALLGAARRAHRHQQEEGREGGEEQPPLEVVEEPLFRLLLTVHALAQPEEPAAQRSTALLEQLAAARGEASAALWARRLPPLLAELRGAAGGGAWAAGGAERRVLEAALAGAAAGDAARAGALAAALADAGAAAAAAAAPHHPPEARVRVLALLGAALAARPSPLHLLPGPPDRRAPRARAFAAALLRDALLPALVWQAGRAAEATRVAAAACLDALLRALPPADGDAEDPAQLELTESMIQLLPLLPSLAEDGSRRTRMLALRCAPVVLQYLSVASNDYSLGQQLCTLFQATLRRLDDVDDEVRIGALRTAERMLPLIPAEAGAAVQAESAFDVLLIHLDDPDAQFRSSVLRALENMGQLFPKPLCEKTRAALSKFRNPAEAEELLKRIEACTVESNE